MLTDLDNIGQQATPDKMADYTQARMVIKIVQAGAPQ